MAKEWTNCHLWCFCEGMAASGLSAEWMGGDNCCHYPSQGNPRRTMSLKLYSEWKNIFDLSYSELPLNCVEHSIAWEKESIHPMMPLVLCFFFPSQTINLSFQPCEILYQDSFCKEIQKRAGSVIRYLQEESVVQFTVPIKYSLKLKASFLELSRL